MGVGGAQAHSTPGMAAIAVAGRVVFKGSLGAEHEIE